MARAASISVVTIIALVLCTRCAWCEENPPDDVLRLHGLSKQGSLYVLDAEVSLPNDLRDLRKAESQQQNYISRRRSIQSDIDRAQQIIDRLYDEQAAINRQMESKKGSEPQIYNQLANQSNVRAHEIDQGKAYVAQRQADLEKLTAPTDYITMTLALADKLDAAAAQYAQLASDSELKTALAKTNETSKIKFRLGPSQTFNDQLARLRKQRDTLNHAAVKLEFRGGVPHVPTTLNGSVNVPMVFDSGAGVVTITSAVAKQLNLEGKADGEATFIVADGKQVKAKLATLASIQVGPFNAQNVPCAILPDSSPADANCLLGETFLKRFVYQLDLGAGVLHLSPISANTGIASSQPTTGRASIAISPASQPSVSNQSSVALNITAMIDGKDQITITSLGLTWTHSNARWPTQVKVDGIDWNPKDNPTLPADGRIILLHNADFQSATILKKSGRGKLELRKLGNELVIEFDDPAAGAGEYDIAIGMAGK